MLPAGVLAAFPPCLIVNDSARECKYLQYCSGNLPDNWRHFTADEYKAQGFDEDFDYLTKEQALAVCQKFGFKHTNKKIWPTPFGHSIFYAGIGFLFLTAFFLVFQSIRDKRALVLRDTLKIPLIIVGVIASLAVGFLLISMLLMTVLFFL